MNVEEKIDKALIILEHIMEADPRTLRNPDCDNAWIFDKVHEAIMWLKFGRDKI